MKHIILASARTSLAAMTVSRRLAIRFDQAVFVADNRYIVLLIPGNPCYDVESIKTQAVEYLATKCADEIQTVYIPESVVAHIVTH